MPLVHQLSAEEAPITIRSFFANGDPGPIVSTLAHVPDLMKKTLPFVGAALGASGIDLRTKEIVILRTSAQQACSYCIQTHCYAARHAGLTRAEVVSLCQQDSSLDVFSNPKEALLIRWSDVVAASAQPVPETLKQEMNTHFDEAEIVELTLLVGATVMLNRYATALSLPVDPTHLTYLQAEGLTDLHL
ncbi:MAG: hypothetical protein CMK59_14990 [Proteobacteria bacterium]|nr:hypothetical protein [Pseudomonadota bacterium]